VRIGPGLRPAAQLMGRRPKAACSVLGGQDSSLLAQLRPPSLRNVALHDNSGTIPSHRYAGRQDLPRHSGRRHGARPPVGVDARHGSQRLAVPGEDRPTMARGHSWLASAYVAPVAAGVARRPVPVLPAATARILVAFAPYGALGGCLRRGDRGPDADDDHSREEQFGEEMQSRARISPMRRRCSRCSSRTVPAAPAERGRVRRPMRAGAGTGAGPCHPAGACGRIRFYPDRIPLMLALEPWQSCRVPWTARSFSGPRET